MRTRKSRRRGRIPFRAIPVLSAAPPTQPAYPRGNPLTDTVTLTDAAGTCWLAYVEPVPPEPPLRRSAAVLPGRRLRFDSLERSLVVAPIPAGSPFLPDERLHRLLAEARPLPPPNPRPAAVAIPAGALRSVDWGGSVAADVRRMCTRGLVHLVAPAALLLILVWEAMLVRPRARI